MGPARRLYVYIVSAVSLLALAIGTGALLASILGALEDALGGSVIAAGSTSREQLSYAIALILVGGPIFAIHWWLARRGMQAPGARGVEERASSVRAWYMALAQAVALGAALASLIALASAVLDGIAGAGTLQTWSEPLAIALVAVPIWTVFARSRGAEIRATRMAGAAAWLTRLYRYGGMLASLMVLLVGAAGLVATTLLVLVGRPDLGFAEPWWGGVAAGQAASIAVGFGAWLLHWRDGAATIRDAAQIGEDDRRTRLRAAYFGGVLLVTVSWCAVAVAGAVADLGRWVLGINSGDPQAFLEQVVGPPLAVVPLAVAAVWHARVATHEAAGLGAAEVVSARRNGLILVSLVGLAFVAVASTQLIELVIGQLAAPGQEALMADNGPGLQLTWNLAQLIVGAALWLPAWAAILSMRAQDPATERASAVTRAHLFLVVGSALVAAVPAATMTLYRMLDTVLGGQPARSLLEELSFPIAVVIVAAAIGGYHGWLLLGDIRATGAAMDGAAEAEAVDADAGLAAAPGLMAATRQAQPGLIDSMAELELELTVHAPPGTDLAALVANLREHLPPGSTLWEHDGAGGLVGGTAR